jgi:beta-propeller repeat-containing protein
MRTIPLALAIALFGCDSQKQDAAKAPDKTPAPAEAPPQIKKPVDTRPLPALTKDKGGATGKPAWAVGFGGLGSEAPRGIAVAPSGDIYVAGIFDGETQIGTVKKKAAGDKTSDAYVVKLGPDGKIAWAQTFGASRDDTANAIAARADTIIVVGNSLDEIQLGEHHHKANGSDDLYVAAFKPDGSVRWLWTAGGVDSDGANAVAATPDGGWIVGGSFSGVVKFGASELTSRGGTDAMLLKLAASGDLEWVKQFGGRYNDTISHIAVDGQGNIIVQGQFKDVSNWGGKPLKAGGGSDNDVVLAKYDLNGDHLWSQRFGNVFNDVAGGVTVDPAGHITMVGSFDRSISFGQGDDHNAVGESDIFVARFQPDGKLEWAHTYGSEREDIAFGVASDAAGNTVTSGFFQKSISFGTGNLLESKGNKDVFALKLDASGGLVWAQSWGDHDHDQGRAVAIDDQGDAIVVGIYRFTLGVVSPALESVRADGDRIPKPDAFVIKLDR